MVSKHIELVNPSSSCAKSKRNVRPLTTTQSLEIFTKTGLMPVSVGPAL
ncbi:hypothetical protein E2C01_055576 [Portunus trituberculatus]|uniref:Uncharacterized protein n=1 Tax=Portunus trituberculatus TaxID=210409 RepID=A0A5B7GY23_PORTR|nr:hypothetical protein [Portunus trituberculatus]